MALLTEIMHLAEARKKLAKWWGWAFRLEDSLSGSSLQVLALITGLASFPVRPLTRKAAPSKSSALANEGNSPQVEF